MYKRLISHSEPLPPTGLEVTNATTHSVALNWTGDSESYKYQYRDLTEPSGWSNWSEPVDETSANVTGLTPGHEYEFRVIAIENDEESGPSEAVTGATSKIFQHIFGLAHILTCT